MPMRVVESDSGFDVVVADSPFGDGMTFYGLFKRGEAVEWADSNAVTDLSSSDWWVVPIFKADGRNDTSFLCDDKETRYLVVVGNVVDGLYVGGLFASPEVAHDWCQLIFDGKDVQWCVAPLERTIEESDDDQDDDRG